MSDQPDDLLQRYADAVAHDDRRPSDRVRAAVRAHAQMQVTHAKPASTVGAKLGQSAANQSKWKMSLVASIAMLGLVGLLVIQIEHGSPRDREVAFGGPSVSSPRPAPAEAPGTGADAATGPQNNTAPAVASVATPHNKMADALPPPPPARAAVVAEAPVKAAKPAAESRLAAAPPVAMPSPAPAPAPVVASAGAGPDTALAKLQAETAQPAAKSAYRSADALSSNTAPRDAKDQGRADTANAVAQRPVAVAAPPPVPAMAAAPPMVAAAPATAAAPAGAMRQRADLPTTTNMPANAVALNQQLMAAARNGRLSDIDALLSLGASVNARDEQGNTALMIALGERQAAAARKLLQRGADTHLVNRDGVNALQIAVRMDLPDLVPLLQGQPSQ